MTERQRITTGLGTAALAGSLVASLAFMPAAGAARPTAVLDPQSAQGTDNRAPSDLAREGMVKMLQALDKLVESIPQYRLPEITENGDIVLRRKKPDAPAQPAQQKRQGGPDNRAI